MWEIGETEKLLASRRRFNSFSKLEYLDYSKQPMTTTSQTSVALASTADIRACFPALERTHNQSSVAYFDGPGGTQVPRQVVEAMSDYLYHHNANTHWAYPTSEETDAALENARRACADFLNASPGEIAFGANMTTLTFHLSRTLGAQFIAIGPVRRITTSPTTSSAAVSIQTI